MVKKYAFALVTFCAIVISLFFRFWHLSWVPGINGDETWYGNVSHLILSGRPFPVHTPNGNWLNPFFIVPHLILALLLDPSFCALRTVPLVYGVATVAFAGWMGHRLYPGRQGWILMLVAACLPLNIAYSRFNWDPSLSFLTDLVLLWACMTGRKWLAPIALLSALIVHPTNIFILPAALLLCVFYERKSLKESAVAAGSLALVAGLFAVLNPALQTHQGDAGLHLARVFEFSRWINYGIVFGRFVGGLAVDTYIAGPPSPFWFELCDHVLTPLLFFALLAAAITATVQRRRQDIVMALAVLATLMGAYVTVGAGVFVPHFERYGVFALPALAIWITTAAKTKWSSWLVVGICVFSLFGFYENYFRPLMATGGQSHRTFRTANPEPKQQALEKIKELRPTGDVAIYGDDWWITQPIAYLTGADARFKVFELDMMNLSDFEMTNQLIQCSVFVSFSGSSFNERIHNSNEAYLLATIRDAAGVALYDIYSCNNR